MWLKKKEPLLLIKESVFKALEFGARAGETELGGNWDMIGLYGFRARELCLPPPLDSPAHLPCASKVSYHQARRGKGKSASA